MIGWLLLGVIEKSKEGKEIAAKAAAAVSGPDFLRSCRAAGPCWRRGGRYRTRRLRRSFCEGEIGRAAETVCPASKGSTAAPAARSPPA